jgi:FtsP/CotA-like multicopper oxidase with cupredoxin domain
VPVRVVLGQVELHDLTVDSYLYQCHILEHEDMGMMRNFRVT